LSSEYLSVDFTLARHVVLEGRSETVPFTLTLRGLHTASPPTAFLLVLDTSLSMDGAKIFRAKQAALKILELLYDKDSVAVYCFAHEFRKILGLTPVRERDKIEEAIVSLKLESGTNIYDTLRKLYVEAEAISRESGIPLKIIFLTDGKPETGKKDPAKIVEEASKLGKLGVEALVIGVGRDYNEDLLMNIAKALKGVFVHVDKPRELEKVVSEYVKTARDVSAKNSKLYVKLKPGFDIFVYNRDFAKRDDNTIVIDVGDVNYGEAVFIAGDLAIPPMTRGSITIGEIQVSYVNPVSGNNEYLTPIPISVTAVTAEEIRGVSLREDVLARSQLVKAALELRQHAKSSEAGILAEKLEELVKITMKIGDEELATRTLDVRKRLEREGVTPDLSKEIASIVSRVMAGKVRESKAGEEK